MSRIFNNGVIIFAAILAVIVNVAAETSEDPMRPPGYRDAGTGLTAGRSAPTWHVDEILISESRRVAIVNGNSVKQGEYVGGAKVVTIEPGYVTLEYNNKLITAPIKMTPVKWRRPVRADKQDG